MSAHVNSSLFSSLDNMARIKELSGHDPIVKELLPKQLRDIIYVNRRSSRIQKVRQYFLKYTDIDALYRTTDEVWEELIQINRFLYILLLMTTRRKDTEEEDVHILLYHAAVPEILLRMVNHTPQYARDRKFHSLPFLAVEILTTFMHPKSLSFRHVTGKLFRDCREGVEVMVDILDGRFSWIGKLVATHFFSVASLSPTGLHYIRTHLRTYKDLCELTYRSTEIVEEKIEDDLVTTKEDLVVSILKTFRMDSDLHMSARLLARLAMHNSILVFRNIITGSLTDPEMLFKILQVVRESAVLEHFSYIIRQLMMWVEPGQYLNQFLAGVRHCIDIVGVVETLFLNDIEYNRENKLSLDIDSFKYWKHETRYPLNLTWFLTHAFCLRDEYGCNWCIVTLCYLLRFGNWKAVGKLIENCGSELMDLAHLLDVETPERIHVQSVILEALLRYGGFSYSEFGKGAFHEGEIKPHSELPDFCLEAALFSKKAQCELKMTTEDKQRRVIKADAEKDRGNIAFKAGKFNEAVMRYTDAIAICPLSARAKQSIYYSNRAESHLRANDPRRAIHDCNRALCLDLSTRVKVQWRRSRAYQKLNLDYPAWLDMRCVKSEWNIPAEKSGVDFRQLLSSLSTQVGIIEKTVFNEMEKKVWTTDTL